MSECPAWLHEELAGLALYAWDCREATPWASAAFRERFGPEVPPHDPDAWLERVHPEDRARVAPHFEALRCLEAGPGLTVPVRYRVRDRAGAWCSVLDALHVETDTAGAPLRLSGALLELEAGRGWFGAHARVLAAFASAERFAHFGLWSWEPVGDRLSLSESLHTLTGLEPAPVRPLRALLERVHPEDRGALEGALRGAVECCSDVAVEFRLLQSGGEPRSLRLWGACACEARTGRGRLYGLCGDVSEYRRAERVLREANTDLESLVAARTAALEAANRELEAFVYSVSHDLRQPLRHIQGFAAAALEEAGPALPEAAREHLGRVVAAARRMGLLIEDLLRLSRLGRQEMHRERVDLSALAREVVAELAAHEPQRRVTVEIAETPPALADRRLLRIALANLIGNAWKFTARAASPAISFGARCEDGETVYFVRDNGAGFDMRYVERLFAPFQRLHGTEEFAGEGVGLAIVQRIVRRHGGRVWARAEPGAGAEFCFTLPDSADG